MTSPSTIRVDWRGGEGGHALFVHANGVPPLAYKPFLHALGARLRVDALASRALLSGEGPPPSLRWPDLGADILAWLEATQSPPIVAIGHSMGATALMYAAAHSPERFAGLVIIEPAMLGPALASLASRLPFSLLRRFQPAKGTLAKRDRWADESAFRMSCERSGLYKDVSEGGMDAFVRAAIRREGDEVTLVFPKVWEAHFYMTAPCPAKVMRQVQAPLVGIRGRPSIFLDARRWNLCTRHQPDGWYRDLDGGHLLPLEQPIRCASAVLEGLVAKGVLPAERRT